MTRPSLHITERHGAQRAFAYSVPGVHPNAFDTDLIVLNPRFRIPAPFSSSGPLPETTISNTQSSLSMSRVSIRLLLKKKPSFGSNKRPWSVLMKPQYSLPERDGFEERRLNIGRPSLPVHTLTASIHSIRTVNSCLPVKSESHRNNVNPVSKESMAASTFPLGVFIKFITIGLRIKMDSVIMSVTELLGKTIAGSKSAALGGLQFLLFCCLLITGQPAIAESACEIELHFENELSSIYSATLPEAFPRHNEKHPFIRFATEMTDFVVQEIDENICGGLHQGVPIEVDLTFIHLELAASSIDVARVSENLQNFKRQYAKVSSEGDYFHVTIIWNERQMWRDHLTINGADIGGGERLVYPFVDSEFWGAIDDYKSQVIDGFSDEFRISKLTSMREGLPLDLFHYVHQNYIRSGFYRSAASGMWGDIVSTSYEGYLEMAKREILSQLDTEISEGFAHASELRASGARDLYRQGAETSIILRRIYLEGLR